MAAEETHSTDEDSGRVATKWDGWGVTSSADAKAETLAWSMSEGNFVDIQSSILSQKLGMLERQGRLCWTTCASRICEEKRIEKVI